jgi:tetratricopeptide (TPR) repeat protein
MALVPTVIPSYFGRIKTVLSKALKIFILSFLIFIGLVILKGILKKDETVIQAINAPKEFSEAGYNGFYIANRMNEKIVDLLEIGKSVRDNSTALNVDENKDIDISVMGIGISASNIIYHLRDLLGIQTNYISGNLTDMENEMQLFLRIAEPSTSRTISVSYQDENKNKLFDSLIVEGAKFILSVTDPYRLAVYYDNVGQTEQALNIIRQQAIGNDEDKKWAFNLWGNIKKDLDGPESSIEYYKNALEIDPSFDLANVNLGWSYFSIDSFDSAIYHFNQCIRYNPAYLAAYTGIARSAVQKEDWELAENTYKTVMRNHPENLDNYGNYTDFLMRKGDTIEATRIFKIASEEANQGSEYHLFLAGHSYFNKDVQMAEYHLKKSLDYDPENIISLQYMSNGLREMGNYSAAYPYYQKLIAIAKRNKKDQPWLLSNSYNSYAMLLYLDNQIDSSKIYAQRAIDLTPQYNLPYSTLAEAYLMENNIDGFVVTIQKAIERGFPLNEYMDKAPYKYVKDHPKVMDLLEKYNKNIAING